MQHEQPLQTPGIKPITGAIIDDNRFVREALVAMLGDSSQVRVIAAPAADATFLARHNPDVVLLNARLSDAGSLNVAAALRKAHPRLKVVVMDFVPANTEIAAFVNAGVAGFVLKDASVSEFVQTIQSVAEGDKVLPRSVKESLCTRVARKNGAGIRPAGPGVQLTKREQEVVALIGFGLSNTEIAAWLDIEALTVKTHVRNVMEKLALHTRLQICAYFHDDTRVA